MTRVDVVVVLRDAGPELDAFMLRFAIAATDGFFLCIPDTAAFLSLDGVTTDLVSVRRDSRLVPLASTLSVADFASVFRAS